MLCRIPSLVWLSAGQLDGMNDNVLAQVMSSILIFPINLHITHLIVVDGQWQMCNIEIIGSRQQ